MVDITEINRNFPSEHKVQLEDAEFYSVKENPWCLFGLMSDRVFRRMPEDVASKVSEGVYSLHTKTSGGRIRFRTDSPYVAICAVMPIDLPFAHTASTAKAGFDVYVDDDFVRPFVPPVEFADGYEGVYHFADSRDREIMIHFPLYNDVHDLYIGLKKGSSFKAHAPYRNPGKIVFYGSSITQGSCVSRPGMSYVAQLSLKLSCDIVNLGFSGNAKGEPVMAEYIAGIKPDIFVMDYDHNAPTLEHLEKTHEEFFKTFRKTQKNVPVVFISSPDVRFRVEDWAKGWEKRRDVVYRTYENAVASGDRNVYFIDGKDLWGEEDWRMCSVDTIHPNDMGHYRMAQRIAPVIQKILDEMN